MRFRIFPGVLLLALSGSLQAADKPAPPMPPACNNASGGQSSSCMTSAAPLLMVSIQPEPNQAAIAPGPVAEEVPFASLFERSPLMRMIAWYCGAMAPLALILLTGITIFEYAKRRKKGSDY